MEIRTGFLIKNQYTGRRGRVIGRTRFGDFRVQTREGVKTILSFNAEVLSHIQPQINDIIAITDGTQNYTGRVVAKLDNGEWEMELCGIAGTTSVHPSQMYQLIARPRTIAIAS